MDQDDNVSVESVDSREVNRDEDPLVNTEDEETQSLDQQVVTSTIPPEIHPNKDSIYEWTEDFDFQIQNMYQFNDHRMSSQKPFKYKDCVWTTLVIVSKTGISAFLGFNDATSLPNNWNCHLTFHYCLMHGDTLLESG
jgi:hypothetical protein